MESSGCSVGREIVIGEGTLEMYRALKGFHYRSGDPGAVVRVFAARHAAAGGRERIAGVLVETLPPLACALRGVALPGYFCTGDRGMDAAKVNRDLRTIARVIVHPLFRSLGVAVGLVRHALAQAETPYVEAFAAMGRVHPFFEKAGMRAYDRPPHAGAVRLMAALERAGLRPMDLADGERVPRSAFLEAELRRFVRKELAFEEMLADARQKLLSQPLYYMWRRGE